jgi:hypothetical protein
MGVEPVCGHVLICRHMDEAPIFCRLRLSPDWSSESVPDTSIRGKKSRPFIHCFREVGGQSRRVGRAIRHDHIGNAGCAGRTGRWLGGPGGGMGKARSGRPGGRERARLGECGV